MSPQNKKITRSHHRQKSRSNIEAKGERFFLQGVRWRFPRETGIAEVQARISRLRELWNDQEAFCRQAVWIAQEHAAFVTPELLDEAVRWLQRPASERTVAPMGILTPPGTMKPSLPEIGTPESTWLDRTVRRMGLTVSPSPPAWSDLSLWMAEQIKLGQKTLPLPPWNTLIASVCRENKIDIRFRFLMQVLQRPLEFQPHQTEELEPHLALILLRCLTQNYPSVPWTMHEHQIQHVAEYHEQRAREMIQVITEVRTNECLQDELLAATDGVSGTFHDAVDRYLIKRRADFTTGDVFDGSGHHILGLVENFKERQPNMPLAKLDFAGCQEIYNFWRNRPRNSRTGQPLSAKHCSSHIGELDRFFKWLHTTPEFNWRRPNDFDLLERKIKRLDSDRRSLQSIELKTFRVEHLALLYKHALPSERLKLLWCLNCSHGAAEIGRVEWGDLYLHQPHPWIKEGLQFDSSDQHSWCGFLRPKTDVIGWWWLWPETVQLVKWWQNELEKNILKRVLLPSDRMLLTQTGKPLFRDSSRNAQTSFANQWSRLLKRVAKHEGKDAIPDLPFGTIRDQMSNWLGSDENQAVLASTALAHGIPHKGDKLLYKHYSNRPWGQLFRKQMEYRHVLQPMFE